MKVICGWCNRAMGEKPGPAEHTSHGMCVACEKRMNDEMDNTAPQVTRYVVFLTVAELWLGENHHWVQRKEHAQQFTSAETASAASIGYDVEIQEVNV